MSTVQVPAEQRLVLHDVDWETYSRLLRMLGNRPSVRLTYDRGSLEIMTLSHEHEGLSYLLGRFIDVLTEELEMPVKAGRSTTFRRRMKGRGLEPDNCYWIANESRVRGHKKINLKVDPPPDLALETDITHSSLNRMALYAALVVPEVWRFDGRKLTFHVLGPEGSYTNVAASLTFPFFKPDDVVRFLEMRSHQDENAVVRAFRTWVQEQVKRARLGNET